MGRLTLTLLGSPDVQHDGQVLAFPTRKAEALLVYLAVEGGHHTREKLMTLLWPESDEQHGRRSLRSALVFLNALLRHASDGDAQPHLIAERDRLVLDLNADVDLDLHAFQAAASMAHGPSPALAQDLISQLQAAANLYRGDFLEGFSLPDAPAFDDWASVQREAWHRRADLVFDRFSQMLSDGGELVNAIEVTARWVAVDPLNEAAHRRLMQTLLAWGDHAAALRAYEACRRTLAEELNAEPARQTETLAERIRAAPASEREPRPHELAIPLVTVEGPLVGRLAEHAQLVAAHRLARRGNTRAVTIEGEPGIGKTRLAAEFSRWAVAQGMDVLRGRAFEVGGRLPYQPLVDALRDRLERENAPDDLLADVWLAELCRLLPELRDRYPDLLLPSSLGEAEGGTRLFESVARLGQALAERTPVVLLLDDLQWSDAGSLDLVQYACQRWAALKAPVLLVCGLRSDDLDTNPGLGEWLTGLGHDLHVTRLRPWPAGSTPKPAGIHYSSQRR